jgi:hypothetical protein
VVFWKHFHHFSPLFLVSSSQCFLGWFWYLLTHRAELVLRSHMQPLKNFPAFYGTRRFNTMFLRALHWCLSWAHHPILFL